MIGSGPFNAYTDVPTLLGAAPGMPGYETELLGGNTILSAPITAGAGVSTPLAVVTSTDFAASTQAFILDGPNSEVVWTDPTTPMPDATHVKLQAPGVQFAHAAGVSLSTGGPKGSLAQIILDASAFMENYCAWGTPSDRGLYAKSRTDTLRMPTSRAYLDPFLSLVVRPRWWPIESAAAVTALSILYTVSDAVGYDPAQIILDQSSRAFHVPVLALSGGGPSTNLNTLYGPPLSRQDQGWVQVTYTAGFPYPNGVPADLVRAANFAAMEFTTYLMNPTGAATLRQADAMIVQRQKGSGGKESSAYSLYLSNAIGILEHFRNTHV